MSRLPAETQAHWSPAASEQWRGRAPTTARARSGGISTGWLVAGAVVVGLGLLAWAYLGPDLRRYLKIRNM